MLSPRLFLASGFLLLAACSAAGSSRDANACSAGSECSSGICGGDGLCVASGGAGGAGGGEGGEGGGSGAAGTAEAGGNAGSGEGGSGGGAAGSGSGAGKGGSGSGLCSPNNDGTITRQETPLLAGVKASYRRALDAPVDTAGQGADPANKTWDFSAALENDTLSVLETQPVVGTWYADKFPGATYSVKLSATSELRGVFKAEEGALLLLGVVSPSGGDKRTELLYATPVKVLVFPMKLGSTWTTTTSVSGVLPLNEFVNSTSVTPYTEVYETTVDAAGTVKTPLGTYTALRLNLLLTRTTTLSLTKSRSFAYSAECFGTVARAVSADATFGTEPGAELSTAAELTRLAP